jgi:amino acid permease
MLAAIVTDIFTIICISSFNYMISMRDLISAQEKKAKAFWDQIFKEGLPILAMIAKLLFAYHLPIRWFQCEI